GVGDRRVSLAHHAFGTRRARGVDVRAAARDHDEGRRARCDRAQPADDHGCGGIAASRRGALLALPTATHTRDRPLNGTKKFAEPVALSSTQPSDFGLPPTVLRFSFDLLALRARRNRQPIGVEGSRARPSAKKNFALCELAKITPNELVAKSEDQLSSSE